MASPYKHALNSVQKWGGKLEAYLPIHEFLDSTKLHLATWQHRAILHNTFGVGICEQIFGNVIDNGEGRLVEVRYIAIKHIEEDCGFVPTVKEWLHDLKPKKFAINLKKEENERKTSTTEIV
jgi:primase-polymerase (primpol)-like protein